MISRRVHHALSTGRGTGDGALLQARWKKLPARMRDQGRSCLLRGAPACGETAAVEKEIVRQLKKHWRRALVSLYGRIPRESARNSWRLPRAG
jgi:HemY protein